MGAVRPQPAKGKDTSKQGSKIQAARMPEVEKQSAVASEGSGESLEKPGGLSFEVVLEEAKIKEAPKLECPSTPAPSVEDIEKRLKEAENRRKSMEASTLEKLAQEEKKREEVRAKKASVSESEEKKEEEEEEAA